MLTDTVAVAESDGVRRSAPPFRRTAGPDWVALVAGLVALTAALLRVAIAGHGSLGFLVDVGNSYADRPHLAGNVPLHAGHGYDGQFYYRLARNPLDMRPTGEGVRLDGVFRLGRIGYPLLAWLVSAGGRPALLPAALLLVNVAALAGLAALGASWARASGLSPWCGLLVCWPGLLFSVDFDVAEPMAVALAVAGLLAWRAGRVGWASAALVLAVLTRETALVVVAAVFFSRLPGLWRKRRPGWPDIGWLAPAVAFGAWQLLCLVRVGRLPLSDNADANGGLPFVGLVGSWTRWRQVAGVDPFQAGLHAAELAVWAGVVVAALVTAVRPSGGLAAVVRDPLVGALALGTLAAFCYARIVWSGASDLRMFADLYAVAVLVLLARRPSRSALLAWGLTLAVLAVVVTGYRAHLG